jgi:hypothetical protein
VSRNLIVCLGLVTALLLIFAYVSLGSAADDHRTGTTALGDNDAS